MISVLSWPQFVNSIPSSATGDELNQTGHLIVGLGLGLSGFLLLAFVFTLLIIFLVPIFLEIFRRSRTHHHRDIFTRTHGMKNI